MTTTTKKKAGVKPKAKAKKAPVFPEVDEPSLDELPAIFSRPRPPRRSAGAYGGPNPGAYVRTAQQEARRR